MKMPGGDSAIVEIEKIRDYCLSRRHPRGRHKARVFLSALGMTSNDAEELRTILLGVAEEGEAQRGASDQYGIRYIIDFQVIRGERVARIRSIWIILKGETAPRFVTCFVL
jgi:hypothetical protein